MADNADLKPKEPAHPGGFIKNEIVGPLGLSVTAASEALGVTREAVSALLNEKARLSPDMAIRIEKAFDVSMETLMGMQCDHDIAQARARADSIVVERYIAPSIQPPQQRELL